MLFRVPRRRAAKPAGRVRRKTMAVVRLGDGGRRKRFFVALRLRLRVRWLAATYQRALRRLRACYADVLHDLVEGTAVMGALRLSGGIDGAHAASFGPIATAGF
jgi:hypothetical protein